MTLTEFLAARLEERQAAAEAALPGPWMTGKVADHLAGNVIYGQSREWPNHIVQVCNVDYGHNKAADAAHIVLHDPARVLRDIKVWRMLLLEHRIKGLDAKYAGTERETGFHLALSAALKAKAATYSDHTDYTPDLAE